MEKDSEWATLYAAMVVVWAGRMQMGLVDTETGRHQIEANLNRARELDVDFVDSHFIKGIIYSWPDWEWEKGEKELMQAITLNPNHVMARMYYAHLLMILQRMDEALIQGKVALELDPKNPLILSLYSTVLKGDGQHQATLEYIEKALAIDPAHTFTRGQLGRALYNTGQYEKELEMQESFLFQKLGDTRIPDLDSIFRAQGRLAAYQEEARLRENYAEEIGYGPGARDLYRAEAYEKALHDSTRFLAILDSMNLPHPKTP
jgi:tetratricopeptide (TPR) repeat protein